MTPLTVPDVDYTKSSSYCSALPAQPDSDGEVESPLPAGSGRRDPIILGYLDESLISETISRTQPASKIGGKPDWLSITQLPSVDDLRCRCCRNLMMFLLQIYAPRIAPANKNENYQSPGAYHRMLYVFICWTCGRDVKTLRCQLPLENEWLPNDVSKIEEFEQSPRGKEISRLIADKCCQICGLPKEVGHDKAINGIDENKHATSNPKDVDFAKNSRPARRGQAHLRCHNAQKFKGFVRSVFPERRLETEEEDPLPIPMVDADIEARALRAEMAGPKIVEVLDEGESNSNVLDEDDGEQGGDPLARLDDPILDQYINFMSAHPPHVIRYGAEVPLWFCLEDRIVDVDSQVAACENCGAARQFEFQIQSSAVDAIECNDNLEVAFGVTCVYTCSRDCEKMGDNNTAGWYFTEFTHRQRDSTIDHRITKQL